MYDNIIGIKIPKAQYIHHHPSEVVMHGKLEI